MATTVPTLLRRFGPVLALGTYAVLCLTLWWVPEWRPGWDAGMYVQTAQNYARGDGLTYLDRAIWWTPGLPWLLSWAMPGGHFDEGAANRLIMAFAAAMPTAIFFALRAAHGVRMALVVAVLTGTAPLWVGRFNFIATEFPFMVFLCTGFALVEAAAERGRRWPALAVAGGAALAASIMVRSVAIVAIPATVLAGWPRDQGRQHWRAALPGLVALVLCLPWFLHTSKLGKQAGAWDQALVHDYTAAVFRANPNDPTSPLIGLDVWVTRIAANVSQVVDVMGIATGVPSGYATLAGIAILTLAGIGFVRTSRRRFGGVEWFTLAYGGVVLAYFVTTHRLIAPLLPFVFLYSLVAIDAGWRLTSRLRWLPFSRREVWGALALAVFAGNLWRLPLSLEPDRDPWGENRLGQTWRVYRHVANWVRENTSEDAVLLCGPATVYGVLTERRAYTFQYAPLPFLLQRYEPDYVMVPANTTDTKRWALLEQRAIDQWRIEVPDTPVAMTIYRLPRSR